MACAAMPTLARCLYRISRARYLKFFWLHFKSTGTDGAHGLYWLMSHILIPIVGARVVVCGAISQYNKELPQGPRNYLSLLVCVDIVLPPWARHHLSLLVCVYVVVPQGAQRNPRSDSGTLLPSGVCVVHVLLLPIALDRIFIMLPRSLLM